MQKKYYIIIGGAALLIVALLVYLVVVRVVPSQAEDEQEPVKCGNKTVFRYKYPSKIFPSIINDYSANFKIASGVLDKLVNDSGGTSEVSADVKNTARQLRDTLSQDNIFFENTLKAYFMASNNDPCNDSLRYMYTSYIREMTEKVIDLKQFVAQITSPIPPQTDTAGTIADTVIAVVDTASNKVDTAIKTNPDNKVIVVRDLKKINGAMHRLQSKYKISEVKPRLLIQK